MSNSFNNPRIGLSITPEERNIIDMYMSQYNQTNVQINRLYTTLDSIRTNINNIVIIKVKYFVFMIIQI